jgi:hypothetical protein
VKRRNDFYQILVVMTVAFGATLLLQQVVYGQTQPATTTTTSLWSSLDTYAKVIAAVVAAITAMLGIPVAFLQTRKTIAEIRKIELEAKKLREQTSDELPAEYHGNNIQILVDPRFAAPLLIVLDFVIAYIILALADYALRLFQIEIFSSIVLPIVGAALFLPLLREALRLRGTLRTERSDTKVD